MYRELEHSVCFKYTSVQVHEDQLNILKSRWVVNSVAAGFPVYNLAAARETILVIVPISGDWKQFAYIVMKGV
jgi:hypothetical protein